MTAYYNEIDPYAAQWLRNLITAGHIAPGEVDTRSIEDVRPSDLAAFTQCHFFAGIGVWSRALRGAGWGDSRPVWTGSCPCQPFSAAGKGAGVADERHLWPAFYHLIRECRPAVVFGEQVASKDGLGWLDIVHADLEAAGYAVGAGDICAAGFGAPHIRQRLYWVADADDRVRNGTGESGQAGRTEPANGSATVRVADAHHDGCDPWRAGQSVGAECDAQYRGGALRVSPTRSAGLEVGRLQPDRDECQAAERAGRDAVSGFWSDAHWIPCLDQKARPAQPGAFPLVDGAPARVGRLRAYGNAIVGPQAQAFVESYLDMAVAR